MGETTSLWHVEREMTLQIAADTRPVGPVAKTSAQPGTRISCHAALDGAARAPFSKERRMKFAKATKFHRKSGEGLGINPKMI